MKIIPLVLAAFVLLDGSAFAGQSQQLWPNQATSTDSSGVAPVASLVDGLARRLHDNPGDAGGWLLLAKSYRHLGKHAEAQTAYAKARELGQSDADIESWLADNGTTETDVDVVREWLNSDGAKPET